MADYSPNPIRARRARMRCALGRRESRVERIHRIGCRSPIRRRAVVRAFRASEQPDGRYGGLRSDAPRAAVDPLSGEPAVQQLPADLMCGVIAPIRQLRRRYAKRLERKRPRRRARCAGARRSCAPQGLIYPEVDMDRHGQCRGPARDTALARLPRSRLHRRDWDHSWLAYSFPSPHVMSASAGSRRAPHDPKNHRGHRNGEDVGKQMAHTETRPASLRGCHARQGTCGDSFVILFHRR